VNAILTVYRSSVNSLYSQFKKLFIIVPIWTIFTFSIKSCHSYPNIFSIMPPITALYRLTIVSVYMHLYTKYICVTYNVAYNGSLYFGIPGVWLDINKRHSGSVPQEGLVSAFVFMF
jgi:hypothetical protein